MKGLVRALVFVVAMLTPVAWVGVTGIARAAPAAASGSASSEAAPLVSASASASASSSAAAARAAIRVRDTVIVTLRARRGERTAEDRARTANQAIAALLEKNEDLPDPKLDESAPETAVIYAGTTPIVTLGVDDAVAAGEPTLHVFAAGVEKRFEDALRGEQKRSRIATTVFSLSLVVFSGLLAFLLFGRVSEAAARIRAMIDEHPEKFTGIKLGKIEVLSVAAVRSGVSIAVMLGHRFSQAAIAYGWLIFGLSLFDATRGYTERLTGFVVSPLSELVTRIGTALPVIIVAAIAAGAVWVFVRFVGLFFESVTRGETHASWLPADLARPTSVLVRFGIIVATLVLAAPLITGNDNGALSRAGMAACATLALACTPIFASAAAGVILVFGRRLKRGEWVEIGGAAGRVLDLTLLEVRLEDPAGAEIRVPHLLALVRETRVYGRARPIVLDIVVDAAKDGKRALEVLRTAVLSVSARASVELVSLDVDGARFSVRAHDKDASGAALSAAVFAALEREGVSLGRRTGRDVQRDGARTGGAA